ncbi:MAG: cell division protein FtsZ [Pseudomonadota bacterium]
MALNLSIPGQENDLRPRITVFGVGGAGGNAVNNMIEKQLEGVEFVVANTDAQALAQSNASSRIQLGVKVTEGLGAGAKASVGAAAAEENIEQIIDHLAGAHMCFITAGMGGGTGTGAAPIIAQAARELGVLTVGVVTKPFQFEGGKRMRQAEDGVDNLQRMVDTLIIIPNQNLFRLANENTTFTEAFSMADDVLYQGVKGVTDLMVRPGLINLDFADVRAVMDEMGKAMMGTGESSGEDRAIQAAEKAIANPLLDEISLQGAKGVLINITGGHDLTLFELDEAANRIREEVDAEANIIVGSTLDTSVEGVMRVSVVATGIDAMADQNAVPLPQRTLAEPHTPSAVESAPEAALDAAPAELAETATAAQEGPSLFDAFDAQRAGHVHLSDDGIGGDDTVPPAAYTPAPEPTPSVEAGSDGFASTRSPAAGTPTPDALARLHAAVNRTPTETYSPSVERLQASERTDMPEKSRFGINSLINRMTGQASDQDKPEERLTRQQPTVEARPAIDETLDAGDEQIEIPAFLRRQAN